MARIVCFDVIKENASVPSTHMGWHISTWYSKIILNLHWGQLALVAQNCGDCSRCTAVNMSTIWQYAFCHSVQDLFKPQASWCNVLCINWFLQQKKASIALYSTTMDDNFSKNIQTLYWDKRCTSEVLELQYHSFSLLLSTLMDGRNHISSTKSSKRYLWCVWAQRESPLSSALWETLQFLITFRQLSARQPLSWFQGFLKLLCPNEDKCVIFYFLAGLLLLFPPPTPKKTQVGFDMLIFQQQF